jgi:hypothetical protein
VAKIYISSTYSDLNTCREAVYHALRQMRHDVIAMEDYVATDQRPTEKCLADVAVSDLYIGLFAWRYGYIPSEMNSEHKSITELEYRKAFQEGKPRLIFLLNKDAPWPSTAMDAITDEGNHGKHITALRQELAQEKLVSFFKTTEHLASLVSAAVHLWELGKVNEFFRRELVQRQEDFRPEVPLQAQLVQFGLLRESYPTNGALLCFGQNPQSWLTGATTRCIYWSGNTRNSGYLDDRDCRGDLLAQFESSLHFLRKCLRFSRIISKEGRTEQYEIPLIALQEAIANALVHREYARMNSEGYVGRTDCIQVEVFDNRVEIKSPGPLPSDMTLNMLHIEDISHPRNPLIARIFYLYGHVERVGSGIRRMQDAMEDADLLPPRFELTDAQTFKVILERPQQIPEEIQESSEFGQLLNLGLERITTKKHQSLEQIIADISTSVGAKNTSLIHKWRHGQIPTPRQIALLAQICVQTGGMDQAWLTSFLKAANYPDPMTLIAELYPKSLQKKEIDNTLEKRPDTNTGSLSSDEYLAYVSAYREQIDTISKSINLTPQWEFVSDYGKVKNLELQIADIILNLEILGGIPLRRSFNKAAVLRHLNNARVELNKASFLAGATDMQQRALSFEHIVKCRNYLNLAMGLMPAKGGNRSTKNSDKKRSEGKLA